MDLGSLLLFVALLVVCGLYVARPLLADADEDLNPQLANLQAEHQRVLDALLELDADWELGKVPEEIYHPQRRQLLAEGAAALRALEKANVELPASAKPERDELEAMIATYKNKQSKKSAPRKGARRK